MHRSKLALYSALVAPMFLAMPAMAQTASGLDEVIVTAQKRAENIQDVPISVATLDGDQFTSIQLGGEDILAIAARVPSVYAESSNGRLAPRFYIRGLGNVDFDLAASQPVSIIIDDVVQENVLFKSNPIFDAEQVEVLRGPQGTLFGRNTPAGIIKFDSRRPTQELSVNANVSYGSFNTIHAEGGIGGALIEDTVSARASVLYRSRDDYIDNLQIATSGDDLGEYEELAGRLQLLFTPNDQLDILLNAHGRTLDGTAAIFRANIIEQGSNNFASHFERDEVYFDAGADNAQSGDTYGFSGRIDYDFGEITFTSITGYEAGKNSSIGDIDGGSIVPGLSVPVPNGLPSGLADTNFDGVLDATTFPGPIPFSSETQDSLQDLSQFTQEIRLASNGAGPLKWQVGAFYFDTSFDVRTFIPSGFPPETIVSHGNDSWAVFGQASYDFSDQLSITGGLRYTDDNREFSAPQTASFVTVNPTSVSDEDLSWDLSLLYQATEDVNLYARVARGFRGPTIQGRDVTFAVFAGPFVDPQSVAQSETIMSYETGFKSELFENRLRFNGAVFYYQVDDQQFSIIGGTNNLNQVINADKGVGYGFETDVEWLLSDNFFVQAGLSYNNTEIQDDTLATATCGSGQCTPTDPVNALGQALIDGNPFPNAPELTFNVFAEYTQPLPNGAEFFINTDWALQGKTNFFLYESLEFNSNGNTEGGLQLGYRTEDGHYSAAFFVRNITNAENLKGGIDFNNLTGFVNEPRIFGVALGANF